MDYILDRRSIRKFDESKKVTEEQIHDLLEAGMFAPSARNCRPWHFIVCDERKVIDDIAGIHPYGAMLKNAPLCIIVCGDKSAELAPLYHLIDCSAATENILLKAHQIGLGACWLGIEPREERVETFRKYFGLPEHITPFCGIAIGYGLETKERPERFEEEKIHKNAW